MRIKIGILVFLFAFITIAKAEWKWHESFPWVYSSSENEWSFWYSSGDYMFWDDSEKTWASTHPHSNGKWLWHGKFPWVYSHEKDNWVYWQPGVGNLIQWKSEQDKWLTYHKETTQGWIHDLKNDPFVHPSIFAGYFAAWWIKPDSMIGSYAIDHLNIETDFSSFLENFKIRQVAPSDTHSLFVEENGSLWGFGLNNYSQLGRSPESLPSATVPILIEESNVTYAAVGRDYCSFFIKKDGSLWGMGRNHYGQLGDDSNITRTTPVLICKEGVRQVSSDGSTTMYLKNDGSLWAMGLFEGYKYEKTPIEIVDKNVTYLTGGRNFIKNDDTLWSAFYPVSSETKIHVNRNPIQLMTKVKKVSSWQDGLRGIFFTDQNNSLYRIDWDTVGTPSNDPYDVVDLNITEVAEITATGHRVIYLDQNGSMYYPSFEFEGFKFISDDVKR